jgi:FkbM family methyltransferase
MTMQFSGSALELRWNRKDLENLEAVLPLVRGCAVAVQAGGCLGVFADRLASEFFAVYTFEPDPELFRSLVRNTATHPNIYYFNAALGFERECVRTVCELRGDDGKSVLHEGMTRTEPGGFVPRLRVDDLALPACDLIYLDVEGDEIAALSGANLTIARYRPVVACEVNRGVEYRGFEKEDVGRLMVAMDYRLVGSSRSDLFFVHRELAP